MPIEIPFAIFFFFLFTVGRFIDWRRQRQLSAFANGCTHTHTHTCVCELQLNGYEFKCRNSLIWNIWKNSFTFHIHQWKQTVNLLQKYYYHLCDLWRCDSGVTNSMQTFTSLTGWINFRFPYAKIHKFLRMCWEWPSVIIEWIYKCKYVHTFAICGKNVTLLFRDFPISLDPFAKKKDVNIFNSFQGYAVDIFNNFPLSATWIELHYISIVNCEWW